MSLVQEVENFEAWAMANGYDVEKLDVGVYCSAATDCALEGWIARYELLPSAEILKDYIDDVVEGRSTPVIASIDIRKL